MQAFRSDNSWQAKLLQDGFQPELWGQHLFPLLWFYLCISLSISWEFYENLPVSQISVSFMEYAQIFNIIKRRLFILTVVFCAHFQLRVSRFESKWLLSVRYGIDRKYLMSQMANRIRFTIHSFSMISECQIWLL